MRCIAKNLICLLVLFSILDTTSQETLPIYTDYLSDNIYLIHPAAAGVGNSGKLRFTSRQQWSGIQDAPSLQTMSFHNRFGYNAAIGVIAFNDKNGFHSQKGIQGTYAYHVDVEQSSFINQLSFALSFSAVQNQVDQTEFFGDPTVAQLINSSSYMNADIGIGYNYDGFSGYLTVKNIFLSARDREGRKFEPIDLMSYVATLGYYFGKELPVQFEPSVMFQLRQATGEKILDLNMKAYKNLKNAQIWGALSYRRTFESNALENLQHLSPIIGINFKRMLFSYTYTTQMNDVVLTTNGFHQFSVGIDLFVKRPRGAGCPNINASF